MITPTLIESLDRKNLSKNADLSATRFSEDLTAATAEQKKKIADLSGRSRATLYKVKSNGVIPARLLVAISFILNVSPYWYTGEADAKEDYSDEIMHKFLAENKYESALQIAQEEAAKKEDKPKRAYKRREKQSAPPEEPQQAVIVEKQPEAEAEAEAPPATADDWRDFDTVKNLPLGDGYKLLESLYIRAEANPAAAENLQKVLELLFA